MRRERGSFVSTQLLDAIASFPPSVQVVFLYARALARRARFRPPLRRLAKVMGENPGDLESIYRRTVNLGLLNDQWLGHRNELTDGRVAYVTVMALNGMRERGLSDEDMLIAVRLMPYCDKRGYLRPEQSQLADRLGISSAALRAAIKRFESVQAFREGAFASDLL